MNPKLAEVIEAGMALDSDEREIAALTLLQADDAGQTAIDTTWRSEIDRRLDEVLNDEVELVNAAETTARLRAKYAAPRS